MSMGVSFGVQPWRISLFAGLFACAAVPASSQTAAEIVSRNLAARGGIEKLRGIQTVKYASTVKRAEGPDANVSRMTTWVKRPNKTRFDTELMGDTISVAFDGTTWWERNRDGVARAGSPPQEREASSPSLSFLLHYKENGYTIELVGTEAVKGTAAYHLRVSRKDRPVQHYYVSVETGLDLRWQQGETVSEFSNYRNADGIAVPHTTKTYLGGRLMTETTYERVEFNVPIEDSVFQLK